jgi:hypothetical protein
VHGSARTDSDCFPLIVDPGCMSRAAHAQDPPLCSFYRRSMPVTTTPTLRLPHRLAVCDVGNGSVIVSPWSCGGVPWPGKKLEWVFA